MPFSRFRPQTTGCLRPRFAQAFILGLGLSFGAAIAVGQTGLSPTGEVNPVLRMPPMATPPVVDGKIEEAEWKTATRQIGLAGEGGDLLASRAAVFWIGASADQLYVALKTELPPDGRLLARAVPHDQADVPTIAHDDSVELAILPYASGQAIQSRVYHVASNARGAVLDWLVDAAEPEAAGQLAWHLPDWSFEQQQVDGYWHVEIAIPWSSLRGDTGDQSASGLEKFGFDLARHWQRPRQTAAWDSTESNRGPSGDMPQVTLDAQAPVVRILSLHGDQPQPDVRLAVLNPHEKPVEVEVELSDAWHRNPPSELKKRLQLAGGNEQIVGFQPPHGGPEGTHHTRVEVRSVDGNVVYYRRSFRWQLEPAESRWSVGEEQRRAVDLQFKYYPYHDKIRYRISIESLPLRRDIPGATLRLHRANEKGQPVGDALWEQAVAFSEFLVEATSEIPSLAEGRYVLAVELRSDRLGSVDPVLQPFERQVFDWEHNRLGFSDEVMPPFEPLEVDGCAVRAVLRNHEHAPSGLWSQVVAKDEPLLAGPMRWEVATDAANGTTTPQTVAADPWRPIRQRASEVVGRSSWSAGPLQAEVETSYDYDGMMLVSLCLKPTEVKVHRVSLAIPLRDELARYMHAIGDGLRFNCAGFTPQGEGAVWNSNQAERRELLGTFYPYLWLGDGERGLCWFADTDCDWILDDTTPTIELQREGDTLWMRVHFVTRPTALHREHQLVFGLQATPTRPMPEGWRRWTGIKNVGGGRPVRWLGASYYWGALSYDVYPLERRFDFYDQLREARTSGQTDPHFIASWMKMVSERVAPAGSDEYEKLLRHVHAGFYAARSSRWADGYRLIPYTNPRGVGFHVPEFATFQDEWLRFRYYNRDWDPKVSLGYDVSPSPSYQDYALWNYRKMLRCFDGVYWDNMYLAAHYDPVVGGAWVDADGRTHPGLGLMHLRQLAKRTAIMLWQETRDFPEGRRPPITLAHMTNAQIVPVMSFLNCTMDWEWKYGYDDFQDRFSADLIVAESIGRPVGAWPTVLAGGHPEPDDPRLPHMYRTRLGVALVHEIQVFSYRPARDEEVYRQLFDFGYGTEQCRVYNYWQAGHPVRVEGTEACTLVVARPDAAVVVVTDYAEGGDCRLAVDLKRLGLGEGVAAVDLESGQPVRRVEAGVFVFPIKKHDYRILRIE